MFDHNYEPSTAEREAAETHLDRVTKIKLQKHSKTIIVGENCCGKSLFRQIVRIGGEFKMYHASMEIRTSSNPSMGALSGMAQDLPWMATSYSTLGCIEQILKQVDRSIAESRAFGICVDEPEIGLGMGAQRGLASWLFKELEKRANSTLCTLLITHSPVFVRQGIQHKWDFLDLSMKPVATGNDWLNKQADENYVIAPEELMAKSSALFVTVRDRLIKNKKKGKK